MLAAAASGQAKHHPVYPGTRTVRGTTGSRFGRAWGLTEYVLLTGERLRFNRSRNEPDPVVTPIEPIEDCVVCAGSGTGCGSGL